MPSVSNSSLTAQSVALLQVEGMLSVRVVPRFQLLSCQVGFLIEAAQQLALLLSPRGLGHLRETQNSHQPEKEKKYRIETKLTVQQLVEFNYDLQPTSTLKVV